MKVAYIFYQFPAETFTVDEIEGVKKNGIDVSIFALGKSPDGIIHRESGGSAQSVFYAPDPKKGIKSFVRVLMVNLGFFFSSPLGYIFSVFKYSFKTGKKEFSQIFYLCSLIKKENPQHIHAHFAGLNTTVAMVISRFLRIPFSFTVHAHDIFIPDCFLEEKLSHAKFVIAISAHNKEYLLDKYHKISSDKIKVIHCGVDTRLFVPRARTSASPIQILSGGRFVEKKGFEYLLRACGSLTKRSIEFKCNIFGDGPLRERLCKEIKDLGVEKVVSFNGAMSRDGVVNLLNESDIFALPCIIAKDGDRDGIPVVLMEAMSSGKAVVSTNVSGIPELIDSDEDGILVPQKDEAALAQAILDLMENKALREEFGKKARRKIEEKFNLFKNATVITGLFRESGNRKFRFKILYVSGTAYIGGGEVSLLNLLKRLSRNLFYPIVVLPGPGPLEGKLKELGIDVRYCPVIEFSRRQPFYFILCLFKLMRLIRKERIDLVHANSIYVAEQSFLAAKLGAAVCMCHVRDLVPVLGAGIIRSGAFKAMDKLIAISEAVKKDLIQKICIPENKIIRIYNGVDAEEFNPGISGEDFRREFNLGHSKLVGMAARLSSEKGQEIFLGAASEVLKEYQDVRFIIVGDAALGSEAFKKKILDLSARLGLEDKVIFTGFRDDFARVMAALDMVIVPSVAEPFGRVTIEAMAMGKPVIATNSGGSPELLRDGGGVLIQPNNVPQLKQAIIELLRDPRLSNNIGKEGRRIALEKFNIGKYVAGVEKIYKEVLHK